MDKIVISHLGLTEKDLILIKNLFRLNTTWFGNFELAAKPGSLCGQIILIDQDETGALMHWRRLQPHYPKDCVISIGKNSATPLGGQHIDRPIVFRRLTQALVNATSVSQAPRQERQAGRVLVVDDSLAVRTFMKQKLHDLYAGQFRVELACSGEEALERVNQERYDLVFMDVMMDGMDGYKACRSLKTQHKVPVVMLTSKGSAFNKVKAHMSGCDGFIVKPPTNADLMRTVDRYLMRSGEEFGATGWATTA